MIVEQVIGISVSLLLLLAMVVLSFPPAGPYSFWRWITRGE